jgi:hypothetical protein
MNDIYDPLEDPEDTIDMSDLPPRKDRIKSILATILNRPKIVRLPKPPMERSAPGVTYITGGAGTTPERTHWIASTLIFNPHLKYSLYKLSNRATWYTALDQHFEKVAEQYPGCRRIGGCGIIYDEDDDWDGEDILHLIQFDDTETLEQFRLSPYYVPLHTIIPLPHAKTEAVFEDNDSAQRAGWRNMFKDTDFNDDEIAGIMSNYHDFDRMETIFLGDRRSLNNCYRAIGGKAHYAWLSYSLAKAYKEKGL